MQDLFDKVSEIIQTNGKDILKDNKFWSILTDVYSFQKDPILKIIFKDILNSSYINEISSSLLKKQSLKIVRNYYETYKTKYPNDEKEILATLFSIACGLGKCSFKDYTSFGKKNIKSPKNQNPPRKKQKKSPQPSIFKRWPRILLWIVIVTGLIVTVGGTWLYKLYLRGTSMEAVIFLIALLQFPYAGFIWLINKFNRNIQFKKTLILITYPFAIAALINSALWFPLMIFRAQVGNYLELYGWSETDFGSAFSCILGAFFFYGIYKIFWNVREERELYCKGYYRWTIHDKWYVSFSLYSLISLYFLICVLSPSFYKIKGYYGDKFEVSANKKLELQRTDVTKDLSYMGISIGENYTNVFDSVSKFAPVVFYADCHVTIKGNESIWQVIKSIDTDHKDSEEDDPGPDNVSLKGRFFYQFDSLYNQPIDFYVYSFNNAVNMLKLSFKNKLIPEKSFNAIKKIYEEKYGSPEKYNSWDILSYGEDSKFNYNKDGKEKHEILIWTFKNGLIYLSDEEIFYLSKYLYSLILSKKEESLEIKEKIELQKIEQIKKEQMEKQEMERLKKLKDSIDQIENYNRALKNI